MAMQKVGLHAVAATVSVQQQMTRAGMPFNRDWLCVQRGPVGGRRELSSICVIPRSSGRHGSVSTIVLGATSLVFTLCLLAGCGGGKPDVPVGDAAEKIRKLALAYVEYASTNNGRGPADKE